MAFWKSSSIVALALVASVALALAQEETSEIETETETESPIVARVLDFEIDEDFLKLTEPVKAANRETLGDGPKYRAWMAGVQDRLLRTFIFNKLRKDYNIQNGITASNEEIDAFAAREQQARISAIGNIENRIMDIETEMVNLNNQGKPISGELIRTLNVLRKKMNRLQKDPSQMYLSDGQKNMYKDLVRDRNANTIRIWKFNKIIHEQFGGRVAPQDLSYEPFEAYAQWLEVSESLGDFEIIDEQLRKAFWNYFRRQPENAIDPFPGMYDDLRWIDSDLP